MAGIAAKSYSDALFALAQEEQKLDTFKADVCMMDEQLKAYPDFMRVLTHPKIHKEEKKQTLASVFGSEVDHMVLNFAKLLIDKKPFSEFSRYYQRVCKSSINKVKQYRSGTCPYGKRSWMMRKIKRLKIHAGGKSFRKTVELHIQEDPESACGTAHKRSMIWFWINTARKPYG